MRWVTTTIAIIAVGALAYHGWQRGNRFPEHQHIPGAHGGIIVAVGDDHYHIEALLTDDGLLKLFTLGEDQTEVLTVPVQKLTAYARTPGRLEAVTMTLQPKPQSGDPSGKTSSFEGPLPAELRGQTLAVTVPNIAIENRRFRFAFLVEDDHVPAMPAKVTDDAERKLYLTPGGKYTPADIVANGSMTASQKFAGFMSAHDMHPDKGALICPITQTKANAKCTWIIGGKTYSFCCPPCIDEFVKLAKDEPEKVLDPSAYVKK